MLNRSAILCLAILVVAAVAVGFVYANVTPSQPFGYDEADYMYAGTRGFLNNYLDRPSMSLFEFVEKGLELRKNQGERRSMSQVVRASGDIDFYRHYHGPMYAYWIALCKAAGARDAGEYRASGLILQGIACIVLFLLFREIFPGLPMVAAFGAALTFLMNRTALIASTTITQHLVFTFLSLFALFAMARFCRDRNPRYLYVVAVACGLAFCAVEISAVLTAAMVLTLALCTKRDEWRATFVLLAKAAGVFVATVLIFWPRGVIELGALKGFLYLAYMALARKTFSPIGPVALWTDKFKYYPYEFVIPAVCLVALLAGWKHLRHRRETLPFVVYACLFVLATMFVTLPYTYYHESLLLASTVLVGIALGELWLRTNVWGRGLAAMVLLLTLVDMDYRVYRELQLQDEQTSAAEGVLQYLETHASKNKKYFVPFTLIPTLHYYQPELNMIGYDEDWVPERLAKEAHLTGPAEIFCPASFCKTVGNRLGGAIPTTEVGLSSNMQDAAFETNEPFLVMKLGPEKENLY